MQIQCEQAEKHAIQAYQDNGVVIENQCYTQSILVTQNQIFSFPELHALTEISAPVSDTLLSEKIEILLIGYQGKPQFLPTDQYLRFTQAKIGVECMNKGAACRTFNVLLSEYRKVGLLLVM